MGQHPAYSVPRPMGMDKAESRGSRDDATAAWDAHTTYFGELKSFQIEVTPFKFQSISRHPARFDYSALLSNLISRI